MTSSILLAAFLLAAAPAEGAPDASAPPTKTAPAPAQEAAPSPATATPPASAPGLADSRGPIVETLDERPEAGGGHTGWRHALGLGSHSTTFFSNEGSQYTFHSGSLGYLVSYGRVGAFAHAFLLLPLQARQDGHVYATGDYYRTRSGGDLLAGPELRWTWRGIEAEAGPGFHGTFIYLPGKLGYRDFTALPLGLGAETVLRWDTRKDRLARVVNVGTYASVAYDFWDPMHAGDLAHGFTFRLGVIVGLGARL